MAEIQQEESGALGRRAGIAKGSNESEEREEMEKDASGNFLLGMARRFDQKF